MKSGEINSAKFSDGITRPDSVGGRPSPAKVFIFPMFLSSTHFMLLPNFV
jgi:hypothetical protein